MNLQAYLTKLKLQLAPYTQRLAQRFQALTQREQYLLGGLSAFFVILIFYQFFYSPLANGIERDKQELITDKELLIFMQTAEPRIDMAKGDFKAAEILTEDMLLPTVENSLAKDELTQFVSELGLTSNDIVNVQFKDVGFDALLAWLVEIRVQYGIQVEQLTAIPGETPGIGNVTMQLVLTQG
jgi:general secretion pathway protein M